MVIVIVIVELRLHLNTQNIHMYREGMIILFASCCSCETIRCNVHLVN